MRIDTPEEFVSLLEDRLTAAELPQPMVQGAVSYLRQQLVPDDASGSLQARFRFLDTGYVVKDDDIDLLHESFQFSFAAAQLGLGTFGPESAQLPSTIFGIAQLGYGVFHA